MTLNVQDSGKEASLYMGMLEPSFAAAVPDHLPKSHSLQLQAEHAFGRLSMVDLPEAQSQNPGSNSPESTRPVPAQAQHQPEVGMGPSLYNVHLPDWYAQYTACLQYFLDQAQYSAPVQSLTAYINIRLPCQQLSNPVLRFDASPSGNGNAQALASRVSLRHYIRRLIVTGNDSPLVLDAFFGPNWLAGVGNVCKQERMNYLCTAKSNGWASTKAAYDVLPDEHTPFLRPLSGASEEELVAAEKYWSEWLAMEDWMVGPRSPWE
ncbi:uncharacterized protein BDV14DRAFT_164676 [Aspergillus stella-maris]|uniref:uncharacterized protein n=1 Tax=Aspergillus stella-maris TaxID=1810926 RepID=UPI003CCCAC8E